MRLLWEDRAWADYLYWQTQDKKTLKRINALIKVNGKPSGFEPGDESEHLILPYALKILPHAPCTWFCTVV